MCYLNEDFELIEDEKIDIDSIEETNQNGRLTDNVSEIKYLKMKINELIQAVKQLDKKIKE